MHTGVSTPAVAAISGGGFAYGFAALPPAHVASSFNFIPPATQHIPEHHSHVFVEHQNGVFVPLDMHMELETKQHADAAFTSRGGTTEWNFKEDAKDYIDHLQRVMRLLRRCGDMLSGLACGFSLFFIINVYGSSTSNGNDAFFLASYAGTVNVLPKCYMFLCLTLLVLCLAPMAFDFAMQSLESITVGTGFAPSVQRAAMVSQSHPPNVASVSLDASFAVGQPTARQTRSINTASGASVDATVNQPQQMAGSRFQPLGLALRLASNTYQRIFRFLGIGSQSDSPLRHLMQVKFIAYVGALGMTVFEIGIVDELDVTLFTESDAQRLRGAIVARTALFAMAWLFSLRDY